MIPIITIDGPASSGKGSVAKIIAERLGFHYLESGAIYRAFALLVTKKALNKFDDVAYLLALAKTMKLSFIEDEVYLNQEEVSQSLRGEEIGILASKLSQIPELRLLLLNFQRNFAKLPGLVTDGRDMGSVVFPGARLKVFLTASDIVRAHRRYKELQKKGESVKIESILADIQKRDAEDMKRQSAPLVCGTDFKYLDNSDLNIEETVFKVLSYYGAL